ncbi:MAG: alpha/beta fold hydrolase [Steroidobacteraceae bacterium]|nr:alpha/beta fold hydrolase [Steroidobacteraceae bacterium]MCW5571861.1 alpha/beta fold hydrolase [Steroidobacteraceae bacterium]
MAIHVVFVHGLFMTGIESLPLRRHLARELDAVTHVFPYMATLEPIEDVAARLAQRLTGLAEAARGGNEPTVHLVGHSLGGLIVLRALELVDPGHVTPADHPMPPGRAVSPAHRAVLLGSPVAGSTAAARLSRHPLLRRALGRSEAALIPAGPAATSAGSNEIGVIAGDHAVGLGRFFAQFSEPNDGTVAVRETALDAATDRIVLPVSHTGMLLSRAVARETAHFLRYGCFSLRASS